MVREELRVENTAGLLAGCTCVGQRDVNIECVAKCESWSNSKACGMKESARRFSGLPRLRD
jgi:hypothetical protein